MAKFTLIDYKPEHLLALNIQEEEREIIKIFPDRRVYAEAIARHGHLPKTIMRDDRPLGCVFLMHVMGNTYDLIMYNDELFKTLIDRKWIFKKTHWYMNQIDNPDVRIQATVKVDFPRGQRYVEMLGFKKEGQMNNYLQKGNNVYLYSWSPKEIKEEKDGN